MYKPLSTSITQLEVETSTTILTINVEPNGYEVKIGMDKYLSLTEDEIEGIYYAMHKLKTVRQYNNEPQEY